MFDSQAEGSPILQPFLTYKCANGRALDYTRWAEHPVNTLLLMVESTIIVIITVTGEARDLRGWVYVTI